VVEVVEVVLALPIQVVAVVDTALMVVQAW
jgi:hypothetical protein